VTIPLINLLSGSNILARYWYIVVVNIKQISMKANTLLTFRAMQLAIIGAEVLRASRKVDTLILNGIDTIVIGDNIEITEVSLVKDVVLVTIGETSSYVCIRSLSDEVVDEIIETMSVKALDLADYDVMVEANNLEGEVNPHNWRV